MRRFPRHYLCQASLASSRMHKLLSRFNYYRIGFNFQEREREARGNSHSQLPAREMVHVPPLSNGSICWDVKGEREKETASRGCY